MLFSLSISAHATTYYFNQSGGIDTNDGLSPATAFKTLAKFNNMTFVHGDKVLFARAEKWILPRDAYPSFDDGWPSSHILYADYGRGKKPLFVGSINLNHANNWTNVYGNIWKTTRAFPGWSDVGIIVLGNDEKVAIKNLGNTSNAQDEYFYENNTDHLYYYSSINPSTLWGNMECGSRTTMISISNLYSVRIENLTLKYGGGHALQGQNAQNMTLRRLDLHYIGGGWQYGNVRYGNAIEFWNKAQNVAVLNCNLTNVFDVPFTIQGTGDNMLTKNVSFKNNSIGSSMECFSYWFDGINSSAEKIYFENNLCYNMGFDWSQNQRSDPRSQNLLFSTIRSNKEVFFRNNIFYNYYRNAIYTYASPGGSFNNITVDYNLYYSPYETQFFYSPSNPSNTFNEWVIEYNKDNHSSNINPKFFNTSKNDFRPLNSSITCTMSSTGGVIGPFKCINDIPSCSRNRSNIDWNIDINHGCLLSSPVDIGTGSIHFKGFGTQQITKSLKAKSIYFNNDFQSIKIIGKTQLKVNR